MDQNEQLEGTRPTADFSAAPSRDAKRHGSPYPRKELDLTERTAPLGRRLAWDLGLTLFGFFAAASVSLSDFQHDPSIFWRMGSFGVISLGFILWGQYRGEVKSWQATAFLLLGGVTGGSLFSRNSIHYSGFTEETGIYVILLLSAFYAAMTVFLGPLSWMLGVRKTRITDAYEAVRQSWSNTLLFCLLGTFPVGFSVGAFVTRAHDENSYVLPLSLTLLTALTLGIARIRSCCSTQEHMAYLWTPLLFATPMVLSAYSIDAKSLEEPLAFIILPSLAIVISQTAIHLLVQYIRTAKTAHGRSE